MRPVNLQNGFTGRIDMRFSLFYERFSQPDNAISPISCTINNLTRVQRSRGTAQHQGCAAGKNRLHSLCLSTYIWRLISLYISGPTSVGAGVVFSYSSSPAWQSALKLASTSLLSEHAVNKTTKPSSMIVDFILILSLYHGLPHRAESLQH